jgi:hypothetical protein
MSSTGLSTRVRSASSWSREVEVVEELPKTSTGEAEEERASRLGKGADRILRNDLGKGQ